MAEQQECAVYEFLISADLDGEIHCPALQARVRGHLAHCLHCQEVRREFQEVALVMQRTSPSIPPGLKERLIAALEDQRRNG